MVLTIKGQQGKNILRNVLCAGLCQWDQHVAAATFVSSPKNDLPSRCPQRTPPLLENLSTIWGWCNTYPPFLATHTHTHTQQIVCFCVCMIVLTRKLLYEITESLNATTTIVRDFKSSKDNDNYQKSRPMTPSEPRLVSTTPWRRGPKVDRY